MTINHGTNLLAHFHGNSPRRPADLPIITGHAISAGIDASHFIPSDPVLALDEKLSLAWHVGTDRIDLIEVNTRILNRLKDALAAPRIVLWGGSGGGYAALALALSITEAIAFVWNPQTDIEKYAAQAVLRFKAAAFPCGTNGRSFDLTDRRAWGNFVGQIVYLQEASDYHFISHLHPLLRAIDPAAAESFSSSGQYTVRFSRNIWLHSGYWGPGHAPPPKRTIRAILEVLANPDLPVPSQLETIRKICMDIKVAKVLSNHLPFVSDAPAPYESSLSLEGDTASFPFLTGDYMLVDRRTGADWERVYESQAASNVMWTFSLAPVGRLCASYRAGNELALEWAVILVKSFLNFTENAKNLEQVATIASADHSAASRVKCLVMFLQTLREAASQDWELVRAAVASLEYWSLWLADSSNYRANNHGLMASLALLHASKQLTGTGIAAHLEETAITRIKSLAHSSFDVDGLCNENSVGYHNFNLHCYRQVATFVEHYGFDPGFVTFVDHVVSKAYEALRYCVWQNGAVPTIGDSSTYPLNIPPINEPKVFAESGFAVVKDERLYVSLICGAPSEIHKQSDDSSITIRYLENDVLLDAGSFLYDRSNPYRRCIESARGHSGISPRVFDSLLREEIIREFGPVSGTITDFEESTDGVRIRCFYSDAQGQFAIERLLYVHWPDEVVVVDSARVGAEIGASGSVQRFLFGPKILVQHDDSQRGRFGLFTEDSFAGALYQLAQVDHELYRGQDDPLPRGWVSYRYGEKLPSWGIEFQTLTQSSRFAVVLKLTEHEDLTSCSAESLAFATGTDPFIRKMLGAHQELAS